MATNIFELFGLIGAKDTASGAIDSVTSKANSAAPKISKGLENAGKKVNEWGKKITTFTTVAGAAIGAMVTSLIGSSAEVEALDSQFDQTFSDNMPAALQKISDQADDQNIHVDRLKGTWSSFYGTFKGGGADANESLDLTSRYMSLAGDGAAYYDKGLEDVVSRLKSMTMGNFEAGDAIGVNLNATKLSTIANEKYGKSWTDLNDTQKALLIADTVEDIYEANGAMGQGAREALNWTNVLENLKSSFKRFSSKIFKPIKDTVIPLIQSIGKNFEKLGERIEQMDFSTLSKFFGQLSGATGSIDKFFTLIGDGLEKLSQLDENQLKLIATFAGMSAVLGPMTQGLGSVLSIGGKVTGAFSGMSNGVSGFMDKALQLGSKITPNLGKVGNSITGLTGKTISSMSSLVTTGLNMLGPVAIIGVVLAGLGLAQSQFGDQLDSFLQLVITKGPEIITNFSTGIASKITELIPLGTKLLTTIISAITANLPAIVQAGISILNSLVMGVANAMPQLIESAINLVGVLIEQIIILIPDLIMAGLTILESLISGIIDNIDLILETITSVVDTLIKTISTRLPEILSKGKEILSKLMRGIIDNLPEIITTVISVISKLTSEILKHLPEILKTGADLLLELVNGIINNLPEIISAAATAIAEFIASIGTQLPSIIEQGLVIIGKLAVGLIKAIPELIKSLPKIFSSIVEAFSKYDWKQIGKNIIDGIANGIKNFASNIGKAAKNAASNALDTVKGWLGIHSPSRRAAKEVGKPIPQGIALGVDQEADTVQDSLDAVAKGLEFNANLDDIHLNPVINPSQARQQAYLAKMREKQLAMQSADTFNFNITIQGGTPQDEISMRRLMRQLAEEVFRAKRSTGGVPA